MKIPVDIEIEGRDLLDQLSGGVIASQLDHIVTKKSNDGEGGWFRLHLVFDEMGRITEASLKPFTKKYRLQHDR